MPTGWRPEDVIRKISGAKDVYKQEKYMPVASAYLKSWTYYTVIHNFSNNDVHDNTIG